MICVRFRSTAKPTLEGLAGGLGPGTGVSLSRPEAQMPLVGGADQERDARVVPQPLRLQRVVTGRDRGWGNQSAILSESGLWQEAPSPRAFLTQPAD